MSQHGTKTTFAGETLAFSVGKPPAPQFEAITLAKNPDGTVTLPPSPPARVTDPDPAHGLIDGQLRSRADDRRGKHIPAAVGALDRRLTARTAFEGNELVMEGGVIRLRGAR